MTVLKKLKINLQNDEDKVNLPKKHTSTKTISKSKENQTLSALLNPGNKADMDNNLSHSQNDNTSLDGQKKNQGGNDGYWITLQEWSQCTLKCGGGKSYLQRMCVPPKNGGKSCEGEPILQKDCNTQPCNLNFSAANNSTISKPIIKFMPFSNRPQKYSKCIIKESDMIYTKKLNQKDELPSNMGEIPNGIETVLIPIRLVMNNRTITLFSGEEYDSHILTFVLEKTSIIIDRSKKECFYISQVDGTTAYLCPFPNGLNTNIAEEWLYDLNLFKNQCRYGHKDIQFDFDNKLKEKIKESKEKILNEAQQELKKKAEEGEEERLRDEVKQTNKNALKAIEKEIKLEEIIKLEEQDKEIIEENEIIKKIEDEKKKSVYSKFF